MSELKSVDKARGLLKKLFRTENADLDFGIYRIMNFKRAEVERFIDEDLIRVAEEEFKEFAKASSVELEKDLQRRKKEINDFVPETIGDDWVVMKNRDLPKVQEFLGVLKEYKAASVSEEQVQDVFNHVYEFFSRYYEDGDFIPRTRYGGRDKYYVPYNGEEVLLHWATKDMYYVKTGEYFKKYSFRAGRYRVAFKLVDAQIEQGNVKGDKKFFILHGEDPVSFDEASSEVEIRFNYRALTDDEIKRYSIRKTQDDLIEKALDKIGGALGVSSISGILRPYSGEEKSLLRKHLEAYVQRNTKDFFIHNDLKGFLSKELDLYLKNEVLNLNIFEKTSENIRNLTMVKINAIKGISNKIIKFIAQIEEFQKILFEKKKFILNTNYLITLDRIPEDLFDPILQNKIQIKEWEDKFNIKERLKGTLYDFNEEKYNKTYLKNNLKLVVDTKYYSDEFKSRLLENLKNIDEEINGVLIKSENYQALKLLEAKYYNKINSIYIDPPYNTGQDEFIYKDNYLDSSWLSMMYNRLLLAYSFLTEKATIGVSIDINEISNIMNLLSNIYYKKNIVTIKRSSISGPKVINPGVVNIVDYLLIYSKINGQWEPNKVYREKERDKRYNNYILNRNDHYSNWKIVTTLDAFCEYKKISKSELRKIKKKDNINVEKEIDVFVIKHADSVIQLVYLDDKSISKDAREMKKLSQQNPNKIFHLEREGYDDYYLLKGKLILFYSNSLVKIGADYVPGELISDIWDDVLPNDLHNEGGVTLRKGKKPEKLIGRYVELTTSPNQYVLDFFVGSGTTCAAAQKLRRKWIGVDFGDFFEDIILLRLKNTLNGETSGISSQTEWKGGGFIKYHYLEQFEDTLNNIEFTQVDETIQSRLDRLSDYFFTYMIEYETKDSSTRISFNQFKTPFNYKIKTISGGEEIEEPVDLVETFNYLLGLWVDRLRTFKDSDRLYRVVYGMTGNVQIVVIWRDTPDLDLKRDKEFIEKTILSEITPDTIYINGDSYLENANPIEPEFKRLMGA